MKMLELSGDLLKEHYAHLADKPFFPEIEEYMTTSPIVGMVLEWRDSIESIRTICWATNPVEAASWTIRWDLSLTINWNLIHASDSEENAKEEIARYFKPEEVFSYTRRIDNKIGYEFKIIHTWILSFNTKGKGLQKKLLLFILQNRSFFCFLKNIDTINIDLNFFERK